MHLTIKQGKRSIGLRKHLLVQRYTRQGEIQINRLGKMVKKYRLLLSTSHLLTPQKINNNHEDKVHFNSGRKTTNRGLDNQGTGIIKINHEKALKKC